MQGEAALDEAMGRLADGDRSAFDELYRALYPRAVSLARRRLRREDSVEDAAQRSLMRVFAHASEFRAGARVLPWFYAIVANEIRSITREGRGATPDTDLSALVDPAAGAEERLLGLEVERALAAAIDALDDDAAEAIASVLGRAPPPRVAPATLRKRVSRAYVKLRALIGRLDAG